MPRPAHLVAVSAPAGSTADRPAPRPESLAVPASAPVEAAAPVPVALGAEVAGDAIGIGVRMVQLGAFETADNARAGMQTIAQRFPAEFTGRKWTIEEAQSGGVPFYRLRALGFDTHDQATAFCAPLMALNVSCIPVVTQ